jgi:pimeloyl-ACP methyl ester carboxylesterase
LHGAWFTGRYFEVPALPAGSLTDTAIAAGFDVLALDRPGYGSSSPVPAADSAFERQAELIATAAAQAARQLGANGVVVIGHSIGGMIGVDIAAGDYGLDLRGLIVTGVGCTLADGGRQAHEFAKLAAVHTEPTLALPVSTQDQFLLSQGTAPAAELLKAARASYAPGVTAELSEPPRWLARLPENAPRVRVPIHYAVGEFDNLWEGTPRTVAEFAALFTGSPNVETILARGTGHSIDHHPLGHCLHLRQLAFAMEGALSHV